MATKTSRGLQGIHRGRQRKEFVGREEQLAFFQANLGCDVEDSERCFVLNVSGQGGVGKTWLLDRFQEMAGEAGAITACTNEVEGDVLGVMVAIAEQFKDQQQPLETFARQVHTYRQRRQEIESDPEAPQGFPAHLRRTVAKGEVRHARRGPVRSMVAEIADEEAQASLVEDYASFVFRKARDEEEARLVLEPVATLTPLFLADLRQIAERHPLALFFDTYERTGRFLEDWLWALLEGRYGQVPVEIVLVIAGRKALAQDGWSAFESLMAHLPLDPLSEAEVSEYLARKGITDRQTVQVIRSLSGGLPVLVATLAAGNPKGLEDIGDPGGQAVKRFLKWVQDPQQREVALDAAVARSLSRDVIAALVDAPQDAAPLFDWLKDMPFVTKRGAYWVYHQVVRELMLRYGRQRDQVHWRNLHERLAIHYEQLIQAPGAGEQPTKEVAPGPGDTVVVRCLLQEAFTDTTLRRFCQDRTAFRPVLREFSAGSGLDRMIDSLVDYCHTRGLFPDLLAAIREVNPEQYERFGAQLAGLDGLPGPGGDARSEGRRVQRPQFSWEFRGEICYRDEDWQRCALEAMYHRLCQSPWQHLWRVLNRSQFARQREIDFALRVAETVSAAGADRELEALQDWGRRRAIGVQAYQEGRDLQRVIDEWLVPFLRDGDLEPDWRAEALTSRGWLYVYLDQPANALDDLQAALELNPDNARMWAARGARHQLLGQHAEALSDLDRALALAPGEANYLVRLGISQRALGDYPAALVSFGRVIRTRPNHAESMANRAWTYLEMRRHDEALADFDRAVELNPDHAETLAGRAVAYREMGHHDQSLPDFDRALALNPELAWAFGNRGDTFRQMDRCEEALADLEQALALDPGLDWAYALLGLTYQQLGRYEEALGHLSRAINMAPALAWVVSERGKTYLLMQRSQEALADFERAIALESDDPWRRFYRILTHLAMGKEDQVKAQLDDLIQVFEQKYAGNPREWYSLLDLMLCLIADGRVDEAERFYLAAAPEVVTPYRTLELVRHLNNLLLLSPAFAAVLPFKARLQAGSKGVER